MDPLPAVAGPGAAARAGARLRAALARGARRADQCLRARPGADRCGTERRSARMALALGLPTVWGATAVTYRLTCPQAQQNGLGARIVSNAVFFAVGTGLMLHASQVLLRGLRQAHNGARAARSRPLSPVTAHIDGLCTAAAQLSADGGVAGGDLYDVIATEHGVRVVMGDVRGHGTGAAGTAAAVLGCYREAVRDEAELAGVLRRLERALDRHLRERATEGPDSGSPAAEEFVTVLLLEIRRDGGMYAVNCGHPWPFLLSDGRAQPLADTEPLPPLGSFPLPAELSYVACGQLRPGEALFLYTDGATDGRDGHGGFFPLPAVLAEAVRTHPISAQAVLRAVFAELLRHTGGRPADDVAVLVLSNDRPAGRAPSGRGAVRQAAPPRGRDKPPTDPQPTNHR